MSPDVADLETLLVDALADLEIPDTRETRALLGRLATDSTALHRTIRRLAEARRPSQAPLPDVDAAVTALMRARFADCVRPDLLRKSQAIGRQERLLLAVLLERIGEPVLLQELLLINKLHNATSRRLRALATEHGHFAIRALGKGDAAAYVLEHAAPDLDSTADYWLMRNIRDARPNRISPHERLLALLSARLGEPVSLDALAYVLPKRESPGRGRTRGPQTAVARRVRELREEGWRVQSGKERTRIGLASSEYLLETLERIPPYQRLKASRREEVLKRAGYRCEHCGWGPADGPTDGRKQLEVHHRVDPQRSRAPTCIAWITSRFSATVVMPGSRPTSSVASRQPQRTGLIPGGCDDDRPAFRRRATRLERSARQHRRQLQ